MAQTNQNDTIPNAEGIIKRFGGIRPMATKMGVPVTTVQGWKKRNVIPDNRKAELIKAAAKHDISLSGLKGLSGAKSATKTKTAAAKPAKKTTAVKAVTTKTVTKKAPAANKPTNQQAAKPVTPKVTAAPIKKAVAEKKPAPVTKAPQTQTTKPTMVKPEANSNISMADLDAVRKESMRSGAVAAAVIAGVVTVIGLALFGGQGNDSDPALNPSQVAVLESRLQTIESTQAGLDQKINTVDAQANTALSLLGATQEGQVQTESVLGGGSVLETMAFLQRQVQDMGAANPQSQELSQQFEQLSQNAETQSALQSGMQELRSLVSNIQSKVQTLDSEVETTQAQISQAVGGAGREDVQAAALLLALGQFRSAVNRNGSFDKDLDIIRGLIGDNAALDEALNRLAPHAETGVLSVDALGQQLRVIAGDVIVAKLSGEDASIKDRMVARLNDMVSVSKDGQSLNTNTQTPEIVRAQSELARGNIQAAMREVKSIEGVDPALTQPWLEQAQATMNAQGVEIMIMQLVLDQIQAFKQGGLKGMERSITRAAQDVVRDANRILTNPAINLPAIELPSGGLSDRPDIPTIDMP